MKRVDTNAIRQCYLPEKEYLIDEQSKPNQ